MAELEHIIAYFTDLQSNICDALEEADGTGRFRSDSWKRDGGGGGDSRVLTDGAVFEKAGVNFSYVHGDMPEVLRDESRSAAYFDATGVSIVIHPRNPFVPIIHMNVRFFRMSDQPGGMVKDCWFGGGIDLTPSYVIDEDAEFFHNSLREACDIHDPSYYDRFKKWCDEYFYIVHRSEMRGIGGIFFDHLRPASAEKMNKLFSFVQEVGNQFAPVYCEIVSRRKNTPYTDRHKHWQYIRRGRYAEFNLVYDRGTSFGLRTGGRIESILMSMPPHAEWVYDHHPEPGSAEAASLERFQPRNWLSS